MRTWVRTPLHDFMQEVTGMAAGRRDDGVMIEILCLEEDLRMTI